LLIAKGIFREVYVNFMEFGHTHNDIDALFERWSILRARLLCECGARSVDRGAGSWERGF
jgi:hypothetical protein